MAIIVFDTETNGLPISYTAPIENLANWPHIVTMAWATYDEEGSERSAFQYLIKPDGWEIPASATNVHGITMEKAAREGVGIHSILSEFTRQVNECNIWVGHNIKFDENIIAAEMIRAHIKRYDRTFIPRIFDTMLLGVDVCKIPGKHGYKWPKLEELYRFLFSEQIPDAHSSLGDVRSTARCFFEMRRRGAIK